MSGGEERNEKPTARRIDDARQKGQVAKSTDLTAGVVMGGVLLAMMAFGPYIAQYGLRLQLHSFTKLLASVGTHVMTTAEFQQILATMIMHMGMMMLPFVGFAMILAIGINVLQVRPLLSFDVIKPKFEKLNAINGIKQLVSQRSIVEFIKGLLKIIIVAWVCSSIIQSHFRQLMELNQMGFGAAWKLIFDLIMQLTFALVVIMILIGLGDWRYQIYQLMKQLRMTKQEIKDEFRNTEGNPQIKRKIRQMGQQMARSRMMQSVPEADVIITNPTHISIAIKYDPDETPAPYVLAKGADHIAFKIREVATEHGIPIIENKPLARTLYKVVEVEDMIPPELFIAVAQVLALVFSKNKGRAKPKRANRAPAAKRLIPTENE